MKKTFVRCLVACKRAYWKIFRSHTASVKVIIRNQEGKVLFVQPNYHALWSIPGGIIEDQENHIEALARELSEELDLVLPHDPQYIGIAFRDEASKRAKLYCYMIDVASELEIAPDQREIREAQWAFPQDLKITDTAHRILKLI